ncbi:Acetyltransferase (GNAT) family protein [Candidatus Izimaplasma bacterium HR1]|jgi:predicted GNAT family acetyltransferase|uniref:GNAT family N-acetyltransferase n=1 Tax=Candidatus Izimoplasma sp. HR1 TaxID=1541959 RepID=UPI0004F7039C|nr:Acetyltransferase (GNAT) family protein [Candidatus Izimaplasma bacterium HR1]
MEIKKGNNKFYIGETEDNMIARITWKNGGSNIIVIDHTIVDPSLRGQGIAGLLIKKVVEMARQENLKIVPVCSYAVAKLTRTNEYEDVLHKV